MSSKKFSRVRKEESDAELDVEDGDDETSLGAYNEDEDKDYKAGEDEEGDDDADEGEGGDDDDDEADEVWATFDDDKAAVTVVSDDEDCDVQDVLDSEEKYGDDGEDNHAARPKKVEKKRASAAPKDKKPKKAAPKSKKRAFSARDLIDMEAEASGDESGDDEDDARHESDDESLRSLMEEHEDAMEESGDEDAVLSKRRVEDEEDDAAQTKAIKKALPATFGKKRKIVSDEGSSDDEPKSKQDTPSKRKEAELAKLKAAREKRADELKLAKAAASAEKKSKVNRMNDDDAGSSSEDDKENSLAACVVAPVKANSKAKAGAAASSKAAAGPLKDKDGGGVSKAAASTGAAGGAKGLGGRGYELYDTFLEKGRYYVITYIAPDNPFTSGYPVTLQKSFPRSSLSTCALIPEGQTGRTMREYLKKMVKEDELIGMRTMKNQLFFFCAIPSRRDSGVQPRLLFGSQKAYDQWRATRPDSEENERRAADKNNKRRKNLIYDDEGVATPTYRLIQYPSAAWIAYRNSLKRLGKSVENTPAKAAPESETREQEAKPSPAKKQKKSQEAPDKKALLPAVVPASAPSPAPASAPAPALAPVTVSSPTPFITQKDWVALLTQTKDHVRDFKVTHALVVSLCEKVDIIGNRLKTILDGNVKAASAVVPATEAPSTSSSSSSAPTESDTKAATTAPATGVKASSAVVPVVVPVKSVSSATGKPAVTTVPNGNTKPSAALKTALPKPPGPPSGKAVVSASPQLSSLLADAKKVDESAKQLKAVAEEVEASLRDSYSSSDPGDAAEDEECFF